MNVTCQPQTLEWDEIAQSNTLNSLSYEIIT
jgi:hypothetical protein